MIQPSKRNRIAIFTTILIGLVMTVSALRVLLVLAVIAVAAQAGRLLHLGINGRNNVQPLSTRAPIAYIVTLKMTIHDADGTVTSGPDYIQAIRSDGSVLIQTRNSSSSERTIYFSSGLQVDTNDISRSKSSQVIRGKTFADWQRNPASNCLYSMAGNSVTSSAETFLGEETISGYRAVKIVRGVVTEWHALDYGCALVKDKWETSTTQFSEKELLALSAGEPDAALFTIPLDFREVSPSERITGSNNGCPGCNEHGKKLLQKLDDQYKRHTTRPQ